MESIASLTSREIYSVLPPTVKAFHPLLVANRQAIFSVPKTTSRYGPHPRQELDVYKPVDGAVQCAPVLIFFHGGGLVRGNKDVEYVPDHLVYHNLGAFFSRRGFITVIPNYRLVNDPERKTGHDAMFPSGAVDVSFALSWVEHTYPGATSARPRDVFLLGNSAGGMHIMTWLFHERFSKQRQQLVSCSQLVRLKGIINQSAPVTFPDPPLPHRENMIRTYFGNGQLEGPARDLFHDKVPLGLFKTMLAAHPEVGSPHDFHLPPIVNMVAEKDPEDEVLDLFPLFQEQWEKAFGKERPIDSNSDFNHYSSFGLKTMWMRGHNHISPPIALMSGEGEEWAEDVLGWIRQLEIE